MTRNEILNKYGKELSKEDIKKIEDLWEEYLDISGSVYVRSVTTAMGTPATDGLRAGEEVTPGFPDYHYYNNKKIPVYEVEWIETDKNFVEQRYSTIRIG
jgi:hypothetical protein